MELEVQPYELPSAITFNFEELKTALTEKVHVYETMVYGDEQIKQAKSDRADLNRLKKALNDERIRREKEYMIPFNEFKDKINEIVSIIDKPVAVIDEQIKTFEQKKKDEKKEQIRAEFEKAGFPDYITFDKIFDPYWLNSTVSMSRIKENFKDIAYRDEKAMQMINDLPECSFEAAEYYKQSLDVTAAIAKATEHARLEKAKKAVAEEQKKEQEEIPFNGMPEPIEVNEPIEVQEVTRAWIAFKAYLSVDEAKELNAFFKYNNIQFEAVKGE